MKAKFLAFAVCMMAPVVASADIKYRVEQISMPAVITPYATDSQSFARDHRFYVGAMYNFSMWDSYTDDKDCSGAHPKTRLPSPFRPTI